MIVLDGHSRSFFSIRMSDRVFFRSIASGLSCSRDIGQKIYQSNVYWVFAKLKGLIAQFLATLVQFRLVVRTYIVGMIYVAPRNYDLPQMTLLTLLANQEVVLLSHR